MAKCETCGSDYDKAFQVTTRVFADKWFEVDSSASNSLLVFQLPP